MTISRRRRVVHKTYVRGVFCTHDDGLHNRAAPTLGECPRTDETLADEPTAVCSAPETDYSGYSQWRHSQTSGQTNKPPSDPLASEFFFSSSTTTAHRRLGSLSFLSPDDGFLRFFSQRRPLALVERLCHSFKSVPRRNRACQRRHARHSQKTHGLCRFRQLPQPGPQKECQERLPVHRHGRWFVFSFHFLSVSVPHPSHVIQGNRVLANPPSLTRSSTPPFIRPKSPFPRLPSGPRRSQSRALAPVCPVRPALLFLHSNTAQQTSRRMVSVSISQSSIPLGSATSSITTTGMLFARPFDSPLTHP